MRRWLFAQADESDAGRQAPLARRLLALGPLSLASLAAGSCLVLQDNEVVGVQNFTVLKAVDPPEFARVPSMGAPGCEGMAMHFQAELFDADETQNLFRLLRVNGRVLDPGGFTEIKPVSPVPSTRRVLRDLCVDHQALENNCNLVELIVTSDFNKARGVTPVEEFDADFVRLSWFVLGAAGSGFASARPSDCERLLNDAGAE